MEILQVLKDFGLEEITAVAGGGGTASPKHVIETPAGKYLLRERRKEFSPPDVIRFDHSVMIFLHGKGLPVIPPEKTIRGERTCCYGGAVYELFRFVEDLEEFSPGDRNQIEGAAATLGRMHRTLQNFSPEGKKAWTREFYPLLIRSELEKYINNLPGRFTDSNMISRILGELDILIQNFRTEKLTHSIVHGDYTSANVKFRNGAVAGIFDFDWTSFQNTLYDISRAIVYFCFRRNSPVDGSDIRSLVQPCEVNIADTVVFIDAYRKEFRLTDADAGNLPYALKEIIIGARVRAMRKVPDTEKPGLLDGSLVRMLDSLDGRRSELTRIISPL